MRRMSTFVRRLGIDQDGIPSFLLHLPSGSEGIILASFLLRERESFPLLFLQINNFVRFDALRTRGEDTARVAPDSPT